LLADDAIAPRYDFGTVSHRSRVCNPTQSGERKKGASCNLAKAGSERALVADCCLIGSEFAWPHTYLLRVAARPRERWN